MILTEINYLINANPELITLPIAFIGGLMICLVTWIFLIRIPEKRFKALHEAKEMPKKLTAYYLNFL